VRNFIAISLRVACPQICKILRFCDFFIVLSWLYFFFSGSRPGRTPGRILTVYGLNDASSPKSVPFGGWMTIHIFKGFKPPKRGRGQAFSSQTAWQNYKITISPALKIKSTPNVDRVIEPHSWLREWSRITKFKFKMADGRHIAKFWQRYNSPINEPIWMKRGRSYPILSPTCPQWHGYHGNGRCLATVHWTFSSYGRLEAERVNQLWWNLALNSKLGPQWQSRDHILKFLKFKMADDSHTAMLENIGNAITRLSMDRLGYDLGGQGGGIPSRSRHVRMMQLPWQRPLPSNGALNIQPLWASGGRTREPILMKCGTQQQIKTSITVSWSQIKIFKFKMADCRYFGKHWKYYNSPTDGPIGTKLKIRWLFFVDNVYVSEFLNFCSVSAWTIGLELCGLHEIADACCSYASDSSCTSVAHSSWRQPPGPGVRSRKQT